MVALGVRHITSWNNLQIFIDRHKGAVMALICLVALPETFSPRLLEIKARRLREETGNAALRSKYDKELTPAQLLRLALIRPIKMLLRSPIVLIVSLFLAIGYAYMYLMFSTFSDVFTMTYGFNSGEVGLTYIGIGTGSLIGQYGLDFFSKQYMKKQLVKNGAVRPEDHLPSLTFAGIFMSSGLFCYGWSLEYQIQWIVPILGTALCGVAISLFFLAVQTYLVEAYTIYAASAIAASTVVRCVFGLTIPLAGPPLYKSLGYGWGNTLLGFLSLAVSPASIWLLKHGERTRKNPRFMPNL
jgi:MFS family permease